LIAQRKKLTVHSTTHERIIRLSNNAKKRVDSPLLFDNNKKKKKKKKKLGHSLWEGFNIRTANEYGQPVTSDNGI